RLSSLADQTPEGRSIVELCCDRHDLPAEATPDEARADFVAFTAQTRMSGLDVDVDGNGDGRLRSVRKGAGSAIAAWAFPDRSDLPTDVAETVERIAQEGGTPLV